MSLVILVGLLSTSEMVTPMGSGGTLATVSQDLVTRSRLAVIAERDVQT